MCGGESVDGDCGVRKEVCAEKRGGKNMEVLA